MTQLFDIYEERERIRRLEHRHGDCSISIEEKEVNTARSYYLVPAHNTAVPDCPGAKELLANLLVSKGDFTSVQELVAYPRISEAHLHLHFPDYERLSYVSTVTVTKPIFPGDIRRLERLTRERNKRIAKNSYSHAKLAQEQAKEVF